MLHLTIPERELWNESTNMFEYSKEQKLQLEHSLVSVSKWEAKWHKSFLSTDDKSDEEMFDYIQCMTITQNIDPRTYRWLSSDNLDEITYYIENPMTATTFSDRGPKKRNREIITSELLYYWMILYQIPMECQKWHLNRLITLIRVCSIKNDPPTKQSAREVMSRQAELNAARRKKLNSRG